MKVRYTLRAQADLDAIFTTLNNAMMWPHKT